MNTLFMSLFIAQVAGERIMATAAVTSYRGYKLFRLVDPSESIVLYVNRLEESGYTVIAKSGDGGSTTMPLIDVWSDATALPSTTGEATDGENGVRTATRRRHPSGVRSVSSPSMDVLVAPHFVDEFLGEVSARGGADSRVELLRADVQNDIDRERRQRGSRHRAAGRRPRRSGSNATNNNNNNNNNNSNHHRHHNHQRHRYFDLNAYNHYDMILSYMQRLAVEHADRAQLVNITKSFEGRDIMGLKITKSSKEAADNQNGSQKDVQRKPTFFIDGGLHAREWIAPAVALYLIHWLVNDVKSVVDDRPPLDHRNGALPDEKGGGGGALDTAVVAEKLLDRFDFVIIPVANPDGYEYSMTKDRFWRKTRSRKITYSSSSSSPNSAANGWCVGADANRNWGYRWGETGANHSPCSNIYPGAGPFSEPETRGLRDFVRDRVHNLTVYASLHSYGQLFLAPWGYTSEKPPNYADQRMAAKKAVDAIRETAGTHYHFGTISDLMYPASGTSIDYMQHLGVPYIFGVELRPADIDDNYGFTIPPEFIKPTGVEMMAAMNGIADYLIKRNRI